MRDFISKSTAWRLEGKIDVAVKPRQVGLTTANLCYALSLCVNEPGISILWVSQDEDNARAVRRKFKIIYKSACKSEGSGIVADDIVVDNPSEFTLANGSTISFLWSGDTDKTANKVGRGDTFHIAFFTEFAYWENAKKTWESLRPALEHAKPSIVYDSTPNGTLGQGEMFYKVAQKALRGENGAVLHFWTWWQDPRYRRHVSVGRFDTRQITEDEKYLIDTYGLSLEQIAWRRYQISEYDGDLDAFLEIYPESFEECWKATGDTIFNRKSLRQMVRNIVVNGISVEVPTFLEEYRHLTDGDILFSTSLEENEWGYFRVFSGRKHGIRYYAGLDTSAGIREKKTDWQVLTIINEDAEIVAQLVCKVASITLAWFTTVICKHYNDALVFIEDKSTGLEVRRYMLEEVSGKEIRRHNASDVLRDPYPGAYLFKNNPGTRPLLVNQLLTYINGLITMLLDHEMIEEARNFEENENGKIEAASGHHDDRLLSIAGALWGRELYLKRSGDGAYDWPKDDGAETERKYIEKSRTTRGRVSESSRRTSREEVRPTQRGGNGFDTSGSDGGGIWGLLEDE